MHDVITIGVPQLVVNIFFNNLLVGVECVEVTA